MKAHILIADDQPEILDMLTRSLQADGRTVQAFPSSANALGYLQKHAPAVDMAILDLDFGPGEPDGLETLRQMRQEAPDLPVIILTGKGTVETAVAALRLGAADFIEKDFYIEDRLELSLEKLDRMLSVLRENARLRAEVDDLDRENRFYRAEFGKRYQVISVSPQMQQIMQQAERIASIPRPVLILGERGTGKELVPPRSTTGACAKTAPLSKSTARPSPPPSWKANSSGTKKGPSPARSRPARAGSRPPTGAPSS